MANINELRRLLEGESTEQDAWAALLALPGLLDEIERLQSRDPLNMGAAYRERIAQLEAEGVRDREYIAKLGEQKYELKAALREIANEGYGHTWAAAIARAALEANQEISARQSSRS